jgi:hypothetical protein
MPAKIAVAGLVLWSLSACTAASGPDSAATPAATAGSAASGSPSPRPSAGAGAGPGTATAKLQKIMTDTLGAVAAAAPKPGTEQIRQALAAAGVPAATLEVSAGSTPTGLDVDSIEAASVQGKECVIGQIRNGKVTVTVLPVLASGKCFVGAPA